MFAKFNRVSLRGGCCGVGGFVACARIVARGFLGLGLVCAENAKRPPNSGGEFRRALLPRGGVLGLVVGWWYFAACGVGA